ncbi:DUF2628 domain-containing protein [Aureimonas jatrophae]|uniref:DUF2628 domain-containing protein n=1 Tax=Aureimonas jatrophae TaxID=1166073 RepID=A0A1H0K4G9_9HYPH|nr:DUF2628 domain-containing protein [Aureimonas jatrophae]MBB3950936.1 hypothetical protein [Aureimonas jatrophae]SDO50660.1 Protein of unknown function [Aureimonas jatrophae]
MTTRWRVFEREAAAEPSEAARFVPERFAWAALVLPPVWLASHRLWWWAVGALVLEIAFPLLGALSAAPGIGGLLSLLLGVLVALEGPSLRARRLERQGWRERAAFEARDLPEAEILYYGRERRFVAPQAVVPIVALPPRPARTLFDPPSSGLRA